MYLRVLGAYKTIKDKIKGEEQLKMKKMEKETLESVNTSVLETKKNVEKPKETERLTEIKIGGPMQPVVELIRLPPISSYSNVVTRKRSTRSITIERQPEVQQEVGLKKAAMLYGPDVEIILPGEKDLELLERKLLNKSTKKLEEKGSTLDPEMRRYYASMMLINKERSLSATKELIKLAR